MITLMITVTLMACGLGGVPQSAPQRNANFLTIDSSVGELSGIRAGMSEGELLSLGYPSSRRTIVLEGDEYVVIDINLTDEIVIESLISSGKVYSFSSTSAMTRDERSVGVGSTLAELKSAYPKGKALVGSADGDYFNFVNGSKIVFNMDRSKLDPRCFDYKEEACDVQPSSKVIRVVVNSEPTGE